MAERKPGFDYFFSKSLNMEVAVSKVSGIVYTEDKVKYTPPELAILGTTAKEIPLSVHIVKKNFGGLLINPEGENNGNQQREDD